MSGNYLFRWAGWAVLASMAATVGSVIVSLPTGGAPNTAFAVLTVVGTLLLLPVFYALYLAYRPQAPRLSLAMLILEVVSVILSVLDPTYQTALSAVANLLFGIAFLILGYVGSRSNWTPRGLMLCSYAIGAVTLALAPMFVFAPAIAAVVGPATIILFIIWAVILARTFLSNRLATV